MLTFLIVLLVTFIIEWFICLYAFIRNNWVCNIRIKMLAEDRNAYNKFPPHKEMVEGHGFWIWNVNYYLNRAKS